MEADATTPGADGHITIRTGGPDDDAAIADLLAEAAPTNPKSDVEVLRWQYGREAFGPTIRVLAEDQGRLVCQYSLMGVPLLVDGVEVPAARGADLATLPSYRRRGLSRRVIGALFDAARDAGYELVMSNPNDLSIGGLEALGFTAAADPTVAVLPLGRRLVAAHSPVPLPGPVAEAAARAVTRWGSPRRMPRGTRVTRWLPDGLSALDDLDPPDTGVRRDLAWWRWRYEGHPHGRYRFIAVRRDGRLVGAAATSVRQDPDGAVLALLEHRAVDLAAMRELTRAAVALARHLETVAVVAAASPRRDLTPLVKCGFVPVPHRLRPRPVHLGVVDLTGRHGDVAARPWSFRLGNQDHL